MKIKKLKNINDRILSLFSARNSDSVYVIKNNIAFENFKIKEINIFYEIYYNGHDIFFIEISKKEVEAEAKIKFGFLVSAFIYPTAQLRHLRELCRFSYKAGFGDLEIFFYRVDKFLRTFNKWWRVVELKFQNESKKAKILKERAENE